MKVDFTKIELHDIEGKKLENTILHKTIANILYTSSKTLDLVDIAMQINRGEEVEMSKKLLEEVKMIILEPGSGLFTFARKAIAEFLDSLLEE